MVCAEHAHTIGTGFIPSLRLKRDEDRERERKRIEELELVKEKLEIERAIRESQEGQKMAEQIEAIQLEYALQLSLSDTKDEPFDVSAVPFNSDEEEDDYIEES